MKKENKLELLTKGQLAIVKSVFKEFVDLGAPFITKDFLETIQEIIMFKNAQLAIFEDVKKTKGKVAKKKTVKKMSASEKRRIDVMKKSKKK